MKIVSQHGYKTLYCAMPQYPMTRSFVSTKRRIIWINEAAREDARIIRIVDMDDTTAR